MARSIRQIEDDIAARSKEYAPIAEKVLAGSASDDEATRFRAFRSEQETLAGELADAKATDQQRKEDEEFAQSVRATNDHYNKPGASAARMVPRGDSQRLGEPTDPLDGLTLGQRFVQSEQLKEYREHGVGRGLRSRAFPVGAVPEQRALIGTPTVTALIQPQRLPGIIEPERRELTMRDVFPNLSTTSNVVEFVKESTQTNGAAEVAEATSLTTGAKPESGFTLTVDNAGVVTIATLMYITRSALEDAAQMQGYIDQLLRRFVDERVDAQLLNGSGVSPNLRGIRSAAGIQSLDAAYFTANGPGLTKVDRLRRAKTRIRLSGRGRASFAVLNPENVEEFELLKTNGAAGNNEYAFGGPFKNLPTAFWGLPVVENELQPKDEAIVGDGRAAAIFDRNDGQLYITDSNRDLFERNIITMLYETRLAFPVFRPETIAKVALV